jgi:CobQ-like glutamine amidotransferase family enzyme
MSNFSILHLYPNTLHLNGEAGNVLALTERGKEHGLVMELNRVEQGKDCRTSALT